jgi:hypothetical protein
MADKKISQLTAASLPLVGTEVLPIVQSGSTRQVANNDLRPKQIQSNATTGVLQIVGPTTGTTRVMTTPDANFTAARTDAAQSFTGDQTVTGAVISVSTTTTPVLKALNATIGTGNTAELQLDTTNNFSGFSKTYIKNESQTSGNSGADLLLGVNDNGGGAPYTAIRVKGIGGDVQVTTGNLVIGTSGKGIDFSATSGTGTSELLADYEEGTFTPTITSGVGSITTLGTVNGQYTKIGNKYIVNINAGITTNGTGSGYIIMSGLPTAGNVAQLIGSGTENAITGKALTMSAITTSSIAVTFYDATYPGANGANLRVCLVYQA